MIESFADKQTEKLWIGNRTRFPPELEALRGKRKGQHSIRINQQWRVCFRWNNGNVHDVEETDYH
jgi:proteic killer suppression protein